MPPKGWTRPRLIKRLTNRAEIVLGRGGGVVIVDLADLPLVQDFAWFKNDSGYAVRREVPRRMHRLLMGDPDGLLIDHINRNPLDNRRWNLRLCNKSQNGQNRVPPGGGVHRNGRRWRAKLALNGKTIHLGYYDTREEALEARRAGELTYYGEFAPVRGAS